MRKYKYTFEVKYILNDRDCKEDIVEISETTKDLYFSKPERAYSYWTSVFEDSIRLACPNAKVVKWNVKSISLEDVE